MQPRIPQVSPPVPVPAFAFQPPAARAAPAPEPSPGHEIRDLLDRCAGFRRGLAFLHRAPPECVASALGVPVSLVERARARLERGPERVALLQEYARARDRRPAPVAPRAFAPANRGPEDVVREAEAHPLGVQFLLCAPFETAAIAFGVHPDVVLEARELLARRGVLPEASAAERQA